MTLELSRLTGQVQTMGEALATREQEHVDLVSMAREWLARYADQGEELRHPARAIRGAVPTDEPFDAVHPVPEIPERLTVAAADGSQIQPDPHGPALYYLINIGSLIYRHGSGEKPETQSAPTLGYTEDDLYEDRMLVAGNLLDVRRDLAEFTCLADVCAAERSATTGTMNPTVALVDGSIILWVLEDLPAKGRERKVTSYLEQLNRIRRAQAVVGGFIIRPRHAEVTRLLHLASMEGDKQRASKESNPLERLPDRAVFEMLPTGARSALFVSASPINHNYYIPAGHSVHFFYLNLATERGQEPVIARVEVPAWVARDADRLALVHGALVAQARITGDYPYALARADELAYISGRERAAFEDMVITALLQAGLQSVPSPKAYYKSLTRWGS